MTPTTGLELRLGTDVAQLADELGGLLEKPLGDPFELELVCVAGQGMQRWLAQRLAGRLGAADRGSDGVCAGVEFGSLGQLSRRLLAVHRGTSPDEADPWARASLTWQLLTAFEQVDGEDWFAPLRAHLSGAGTKRPARRQELAGRLAGLFESYAAWRPELLRRWRNGEETDAAGEALPAEAVWQSRLWRKVCELIGAADPATAATELCSAVRAGELADHLPARLQVFAPAAVPPGQLELLAAVATQLPVTCWQPLAQPHEGDHLLAKRLGSRERAFTAALAARASRTQVVSSAHEFPATVLGAIQEQLATGTSGPTDGELSCDGSLQIHESHGPSRQVEVLRELLVGLLQDDPSLEPRDILVACPDIATYAPLLQATFGLSEVARAGHDLHPGHRIRVRVADVELRQANPVIDVLSRLLALPGSRGEASELLELCATDPVARRFRFDPEDRDRLEELVSLAGIRWGLDSAARAPFGMEGFLQNTWSAGLNRMLLGVTLDDLDLATVSSVLPLGEVDSSDVDLVGRLAELVSRIRLALNSFAEPATPAVWSSRLRAALDSIIAVSPADNWQLAHAQLELTGLVGSLGQGGPRLHLAEIRAFMQERLGGVPPRSALLTGDLTVCGLRALQGVPHRVIVLLGLDEATFPRRSHADGDDLLRRRPEQTDPDPRADDRQALLDAVRCATEKLVVIYRGKDQRTNEPIPAPVPLRELLDVVDALTPAGRLSPSLTVSHPLQPFSPAALNGSGGGFDAAALQGARALLSPRIDPPPRFPIVRLEEHKADVVSIDDLAGFFAHPVKALLRERAGLYIGRATEDDPDTAPEYKEELPIELDGLGRWKIGDRMLRHALAGRAMQDIVEAERRRGEVPPDALGRRAIDQIADQVEVICAAAKPALQGESGHHDIDLLVDGVRLIGRLRTYGRNLVHVDFSRPSAKHLIASWVRLLTLSLTEPDVEWQALLYGPKSAGPQGPVEPASARRHLSYLLACYFEGLRRPLPIPPRVAMGYAQRRPNSPEVADESMTMDWGFDRDPSWRVFYETIGDLRRAPAEEARHLSISGEHSLFGSLAVGVYGPLLDRWPS